MPRLAILCPGQGAQHAHMFELVCQDAQTREQLAQWDLPRYLDMPLQQLLDRPDLLFRNKYAQVVIVAAAMAAWTALQKFLPRPHLVMGYSIGEVSAYGIAGALTATETLALAGARAELMDQAKNRTPPQRMLAVSGVAPASVAGLLARHDLSVAIVTGEVNFIVGGLAASIDTAMPEIAALGGEVTSIPVEIASHTVLMQTAALPFQQVLAAAPFRDTVIPVISGTGAEPVVAKAVARERLLGQLTQTIRWSDCMDACVEQGVDVALELGPGAALSRMLQKRHPDIACRSLQDFRSLAGLADWLDRHCS
ncbi:ACP S-malonyltransferase [Undibacterium sp. TJN25]|uniref:ACP S-malonyltransferase n=1 Tax=Undibacterium sp. TJN25 TaxID=3413056 RepID=UPI003BF0E614